MTLQMNLTQTGGVGLSAPPAPAQGTILVDPQGNVILDPQGNQIIMPLIFLLLSLFLGFSSAKAANFYVTNYPTEPTVSNGQTLLVIDKTNAAAYLATPAQIVQAGGGGPSANALTNGQSGASLPNLNLGSDTTWETYSNDALLVYTNSSYAWRFRHDHSVVSGTLFTNVLGQPFYVLGYGMASSPSYAYPATVNLLFSQDCATFEGDTNSTFALVTCATNLTQDVSGPVEDWTHTNFFLTFTSAQPDLPANNQAGYFSIQIFSSLGSVTNFQWLATITSQQLSNKIKQPWCQAIAAPEFVRASNNVAIPTNIVLDAWAGGENTTHSILLMANDETWTNFQAFAIVTNATTGYDDFILQMPNGSNYLVNYGGFYRSGNLTNQGWTNLTILNTSEQNVLLQLTNGNVRWFGSIGSGGWRWYDITNMDSPATTHSGYNNISIPTYFHNVYANWNGSFVLTTNAMLRQLALQQTTPNSWPYLSGKFSGTFDGIYNNQQNIYVPIGNVSGNPTAITYKNGTVNYAVVTDTNMVVSVMNGDILISNSTYAVNGTFRYSYTGIDGTMLVYTNLSSSITNLLTINDPLILASGYFVSENVFLEANTNGAEANVNAGILMGLIQNEMNVGPAGSGYFNDAVGSDVQTYAYTLMNTSTIDVHGFTGAFNGNGTGLTNLIGLVVTNSPSGWFTAIGAINSAPALGFVTVALHAVGSVSVFLTNYTTHVGIKLGEGSTIASFGTNYESATILANSGDKIALTNATGVPVIDNSWFQALH